MDAINKHHGANNCRWATPTLFLPAPLWFDAGSCPWSCRRDAVPRIVSSTDRCATCARWERSATATLAETALAPPNGPWGLQELV
jgi:hypothetical protein